MSIRTPDQRLRVFISSTIEELKDERRLLREAIEKLRLIPVLFESGARPYPPRDLYRAYLEQSDVFIGIYASSYGWVAPDMSISGLEDEYRLSSGMPRLIYVKQVDGPRHERMAALLDGIRDSGVSYQKFSTAEQLAELVQNDLAILLSERFTEKEKNGPPKGHGLPAMRTPTVGRDRERAEIADLLLRPDVGLVTLTGTGGTGKSHLALRVAHDVSERFADGVCFVALAGVSRVEQVGPAIAAALCVVDTGDRSMLDALGDQLAGKEALVLIDNFEHVLSAATFIADLLDRLPKLTLLITSRAPLHLSGELVYPLRPLDYPDVTEHHRERLLAAPSVALFVQRAQARAAKLVLDDTNVGAIAELCRHMDGLPLAIELAASHTKYFTPAALATRTGRMLDLLARGPRDLPERQRTMRAAIASSYEMLNEAHRTFFRRLAVFSDRWTLDMAAAVADSAGLGLDPMEAVEQLVDMGLARVAAGRPNDPDQEPRFNLLHVMREFATEELSAHEEHGATMQRLQEWYMRLVTQAAQQAGSDEVIRWMDEVEVGYLDLRNLIRYALDRGDTITVWLMIAQLNTFWLLRGFRGEAMDWLRATGLDRLANEPDFAGQVPAHLRAGVLFAAGTMTYYAEHQSVAAKYLHRAIELFSEPGAPHNMVFYTHLFLSMALMGGNDPAAGEAMEQAISGARTAKDRFLEAMGLCYRTEWLMRTGQVQQALSDLEFVKKVSVEMPRQLLSNSMYLAAGNLSIFNGDPARAIEEYRKCISVAGAQRIVGTVGWAQNGLGYGLMMLGRTDEARAAFIEGLATARLSGYRAVVLAQWAGLAWVAAVKNDAPRGARLFGAVEKLRGAIQYSPWFVTQRLLDSAHQAVADRLSPELFEQERAAGAALPVEAVQALAEM